MDNAAEAIDIEALQALNQENILRVITRAIDIEAAGCMGGDRISDDCSKERALLRLHCKIVCMIRDMNDIKPSSGFPLSERRHSRAL